MKKKKMYGIVAAGFASDAPCPHYGLWLKAFDFDAQDGKGFGEFTKSPAKAMRFATRNDALLFWRTKSRVKPLRADGEPNRPLTALCISIELLP